MRVALFSDVHGNQSALEAVLGAMAKLPAFDAVVCAGDMVYLGPSPGEVLDRLVGEGIQMIRGNADDVVTGLKPPDTPPNPRVAEILAQHADWNRAQLRADQLDLLHALPLTLQLGSLLVCHSSPESNDDGYARIHEHSAQTLRSVYARPGVEAVAYGDWHVPGVAPLGAVTLVNVSCVSIPMDGQALAGFTVAEQFDGFWRFQQHRIGYDLAPEIARIKERGMPQPPWPRLSQDSTAPSARALP